MDLSFVDESNSNNREEDDQSFKFTMDESKREQWMEESDTRSAYGSIPKQVRKILGRIPEYENGKPKLDDLGFPVMQNRIKVHQTLMNMLRNRRSESHMMEILNNNLIEMSWLQPIIEELESSEEVKTQFYVALKRGFQLYSALWSKIQDGVYKFTTPILNKVKGETSYKKFLTNLKLGEINNKKLSIYQKGAGNKNYIVSDKLVALKNLILKNIDSESPILPNTFDKHDKGKQKEFLQDVFDSLNIPYEVQAIQRLLSKKSDINRIKKSLKSIAEYGLNLTSKELKGEIPITYEDLLQKKRKGAENVEEQGVLSKEINNILTILANYQENLQLENKARYNDTNYMSDVLPSFMTNLIEDIKSFAETENINQLRTYITNKYLKNSYFTFNGEILNKWIDELISGDIKDPNSFVQNFDFIRSLGNNKKPFKNFSRQEQYLQLINQFFSVGQINNRTETVYINKDKFDENLKQGTLDIKKTYNINGSNIKMIHTIKGGNSVWVKQTRNDYAYYNMFVLGDSGISKFIKALRYGPQEILDNMYNVYIQEHRRMKLSETFNNELKEKGIKINENLESNKNKYTILTFLNPDFEEGKYAKWVQNNYFEEKKTY